MKTLKKTLCLVLVLVMSLSLVTVANAAEYTDVAEDNDFAEAIAVMSAIEVLDGMTPTTFEPEGTLTRAQAAKIVTYMLLTKDVADDLPNDTKPFEDVESGFWAAGSIAYLKEIGAVSGRTAKTFDPQGKVTGYEFGKMVLEAAGVEGEYTGAAWTINVARDMNQKGLLENLDDVKMSEPLTRGAAAQLAFNALYANGQTVTNTAFIVIEMAGGLANNTDVTPNVEASKVKATNYPTFQAALTAGQSLKNAPKEGTATLAKYGSDFTIEEVTTTAQKGSLADTVFGLDNGKTKWDNYGRPITTYTASNIKKSVTFTDTPVLKTDKLISGAEMYAALGSDAQVLASDSWTTTGNGSVPGYWDGTRFAVDSNPETDVYATTTDDDKVTIAPFGGNGITTEIYDIDDSDTEDVHEYMSVQIMPTLGKVTVKEVKANATVGAHTEYKVGASYITDGAIFSTTVTKADKTNVVLNGEVEDGDYVLISNSGTATTAGANAETYTLTPATVIEGAITKKTSAGVFTIGGSEYSASGIGIDVSVTGGSRVDSTTTTNTTSASYVLDANGNVLTRITVTIPTNYMFVLKAEKASYLDTSTNRVTDVCEATVITTNGELTVIRVGKIEANGSTSEVTASNTQSRADYLTAGNRGKENNHLGLYAYSVNPTTGLYTLKVANSAGGQFHVVTSISNTNPTIAAGVHANANTKYYVATKSGTTYTGVSTYVGFANVPNLDIDAGESADSSSEKRPGTVCGYLESNGVATIVFVDAVNETGRSADYVYVTGTYESDTTIGNTYDVIIKGEESKMILTDSTGSSEVPLTAGLYTVANGRATSVLDGATQKDDFNTAFTGTETQTMKPATSKSLGIYDNDGLLMMSADAAVDATSAYKYVYYVNDTVPVYTIENGAMTVGTAAQLHSVVEASLIVVLFDNGVITEIYIVAA